MTKEEKFSLLVFCVGYAAQNGQITLTESKELLASLTKDS